MHSISLCWDAIFMIIIFNNTHPISLMLGAA
jgi:hypothetical protein